MIVHVLAFKELSFSEINQGFLQILLSLNVDTDRIEVFLIDFDKLRLILIASNFIA